MHRATTYQLGMMHCVLLLFAVIVLRTAWIGDDAAITLRTVLNFVHGYGPTFNVDERVQAYTHPLWFLLLSGLTWLTSSLFFSVYVLSFLCSLVCLYLLLRYLPTSVPAGLLGAGILLFSKAYVDYSTSGLENPLSHLLLVLLVLAWLRLQLNAVPSRLLAMLLCTSLLFLTRPDLLLLCVPLAVVSLASWRLRWRALLGVILLSSLPVVVWLLFSTWYYGFPFPNTAYAKLGTGIALSERVPQGFYYLLDSLARDPLTLAVITLGFLVGVRGPLLERCLALGVLIYLHYIIYIGGDFMSGRFLTAPLLISVIILVRQPWPLSRFAVPGAVFALLAVNGFYSTLLSSNDYADTRISATGIADERGFYFQQHGLLAAKRNSFELGEWQVAGRSVDVTCGGLGFTGLLLGPGTHLVDSCGLADPLLARLPAKYDPDWRAGHFIRTLPAGYLQSIHEDANLISEPSTAELYESLRLVTRGELGSSKRLREIARLNLGLVAPPDRSLYRHDDGVPVVPLELLARPVQAGTPWDASTNITFSRKLDILLPQPVSIHRLDVTLDHNDHYRFEYLHAGSYHLLTEIPPTVGWGMQRHYIRMDEPSLLTTRVRITAVAGDGLYSIGHFIVE